MDTNEISPTSSLKDLKAFVTAHQLPVKLYVGGRTHRTTKDVYNDIQNALKVVDPLNMPPNPPDSKLSPKSPPLKTKPDAPTQIPDTSYPTSNTAQENPSLNKSNLNLSSPPSFPHFNLPFPTSPKSPIWAATCDFAPSSSPFSPSTINANDTNKKDSKNVTSSNSNAFAFSPPPMYTPTTRYTDNDTKNDNPNSDTLNPSNLTNNIASEKAHDESQDDADGIHPSYLPLSPYLFLSLTSFLQTISGGHCVPLCLQCT
jgi:hypothetical protein